MRNLKRPACKKKFGSGAKNKKKLSHVKFFQAARVTAGASISADTEVLTPRGAWFALRLKVASATVADGIHGVDSRPLYPVDSGATWVD
jgi:hypothetical protein